MEQKASEVFEEESVHTICVSGPRVELLPCFVNFLDFNAINERADFWTWSKFDGAKLEAGDKQ